MIDGIKQEQLLVGSGYIDYISGVDLVIGPGNVGLVEIASIALDGDTNTLSSGSRWVTFRSAFAAPPFVSATFGHNAKVANAGDANWIAAGSIAAGSFLALGSPASYAFNWLAVGSR